MEILIHGICSTKTVKELIDKKENNMAIVMSIKPEFCEKIFSGEKKFEVRKTIPQNIPTKVYVYQSGSGGVVGDFIATYYFEFPSPFLKSVSDPQTESLILDATCLTLRQLYDYLGAAKCLYKIRIEYPNLYETPIPVNVFGLSRPPQSWCYTNA